MVDVTDCVKNHPIQIGEEVVIFGSQEGTFLSPKIQAQNSNTICYELFSRLGERVERVYKN